MIRPQTVSDPILIRAQYSPGETGSSIRGVIEILLIDNEKH